MADQGKRFAVLASGSGTNFQALAEAFQNHPRHRLVLLVCDKPGAGCLDRAQNLQIPSNLVIYEKGKKTEAENRITQALESAGADLVVLAGFMRLFSADFVRRWQGQIVNIHPTLLPRHPGAHGIADSFLSGDPRLGVTVHWVDEGMDTGQIIAQESFDRTPDMSLEEAEDRIHRLEHRLYPQVVGQLLDRA